MAMNPSHVPTTRPSDLLREHVFFDPRLGVAVLAIPKAGCSAIKHWLVDALGERGPLGAAGQDVHGFAFERYSLASHEAGGDAVWAFAARRVGFVRDPLARLRSAFIDKLVRPADADLFPPAAALVARIAEVDGVASGPGRIRRPSFRRFVEFVLDAESSTLDAHWRPQSDFLSAAGPLTVHPAGEIARVLADLGAAAGLGRVVPTETNVTRKEPSGRGPLADAPGDELHALGLRPTLDEMVDERLRRRCAESPDAVEIRRVLEGG